MGTPDTRDKAADVVADELCDALDRIAPAGVTVGVRQISTADVDRLSPAERGLTNTMSPARLAEFASGRLLLHDLIGTVNSILRTSSGAPLLPAGFIGSLAHDRHHGVAVVTDRTDVSTMGVDLEPIDASMLTDDEAAIILRDDDVVPGALAAFVMKEATYKAWSGLGGQMLEHHDVCIDHDRDTFSATVLVDPPWAMPTTFVGRLTLTTHHWLALVVATAD